jgi:DNA polymerase III delta subunit
MLHLFSGNDRDALKKAFDPLIREAQVSGSYRRHAGDTTVAMLDPYFTDSLFGETYTVLLDGFSLFPEDTRLFLISQLSSMKESQNVFIVLDEKFSKELKDGAKHHRVEIVDYSIREAPSLPSVFGFTDRYLARDKKEAWLSFVGLQREGVAGEEIHGALFWAVKTVFLVKTVGLGKSAEELGMKPYPYQKAKNFSTKWSVEDITRSLKDLTRILEETRIQGGDLSIALESFVLRT